MGAEMEAEMEAGAALLGTGEEAATSAEEPPTPAASDEEGPPLEQAEDLHADASQEEEAVPEKPEKEKRRAVTSPELQQGGFEKEKKKKKRKRDSGEEEGGGAGAARPLHDHVDQGLPPKGEAAEQDTQKKKVVLDGAGAPRATSSRVQAGPAVGRGPRREKAEIGSGALGRLFGGAVRGVKQQKARSGDPGGGGGFGAEGDGGEKKATLKKRVGAVLRPAPASELRAREDSEGPREPVRLTRPVDGPGGRGFADHVVVGRGDHDQDDDVGLLCWRAYWGSGIF